MDISPLGQGGGLLSTLLNENNKKMLASWARSFVGASLAVYMTGNQDPKAIATAGLAALAPVIMRWLNPNDAAFGRKK
jgi:hypothetical protein